MIVLDTNVASELMRSAPDLTVVDWVGARHDGELYTTAITLAEIRYGIERLPDGRRKELLGSAAAEVFRAFEDHVLPFDARAAAAYPSVVTARERAGLPINGFDAQIAAICRSNRAALSTRNVKDFQQTGVDIVDPWQGA